MKKILLILMSFLLYACAMQKTATLTNTKILSDVDSTNLAASRHRSFIDTTKTSSKTVKITRIEFFNPSKDGKEKDPDPEWQRIDKDDPEESEDDGDTIPSLQDIIEQNLPNIKSIEVTEIVDQSIAAGKTERDSVIVDSTKVRTATDEDTQIDQKTKPVDPYKWRWIFGIVFVVGVILLALWLVFRKK